MRVTNIIINNAWCTFAAALGAVLFLIDFQDIKGKREIVA